LTAPPRDPRRVVVVGGGISGLAAAYTLARARRDGKPVEEILIESAPRLGGVIQSEQVEGCVVEAGPDSFLAEKPEAAALARDLGLGDLLVGSNDRERRTYILHRGKLESLPDGLMLLVPTRIWPMISTPLLSFSAKLAMASEWFQGSRQGAPQDESVADFVDRHFGREMLDNIADPLLAGVYGGDSTRLSVRSVLPRFWKMEQEHGSLTRATLRAMKRRKKENSSEKPSLFMTITGGLSQLTSRLAAQAESSRILVGRSVEGIDAVTGSSGVRYRVRVAGGTTFDAAGVILAVPAFAAAKMLFPLNRALASELAEIPYTSAITVSLGFDEKQVENLPPGFGFLVPAKENRRLLAATFVHRKLPQSVAEGSAMVRCFLGGARDPEVMGLNDEEVLSNVRRELKEILDLTAEPRFVRIHRWPNSMAQYVLGHDARQGAIQRELKKLPGVFLAGNAYSGIGISDCIRTGKAAAEAALHLIGA
jgi:protoporphyrinogen/coproporphyrinogen III oxidase